MPRRATRLAEFCMADPSANLTERISNWLVRRRAWLFGVAFCLTAAGIWPSMQLAFDTAVVNLFPANDPVRLAYEESVAVFGGDELVVVAYTDPNLLSPDGLDRVQELAERFRAIGSDWDDRPI